MRIVVADNDGGGIFSFLPQASQVNKDVFENLFGTPHGADIAMLARKARDQVQNTFGITLEAEVNLIGIEI